MYTTRTSTDLIQLKREGHIHHVLGGHGNGRRRKFLFQITSFEFGVLVVTFILLAHTLGNMYFSRVFNTSFKVCSTKSTLYLQCNGNMRIAIIIESYQEKKNPGILQIYAFLLVYSPGSNVLR